MRTLERPLGMVATAAGVVAGVVLLGIMITTVLDVSLRATVNFAFLGVTEITELGLVIVAAFGIAYCAWSEGHIALEFGEKLLSAQAWRVLQVIGGLASAAIAGAVAVCSLVEAAAVHGRNAHTNLLQIPEYPFYLAVGAGFLISVVILLYKIVAEREAHPSGPRE